MCGIWVSLRQVHEHASSFDDAFNPFEKLSSGNIARGPDAQNMIQTILPLQSSPKIGVPQSLILNCFASELQLRGDATVIQPHFHDGSMLCWNGEEREACCFIFDGLEVLPQENDGEKLFQSLCKTRTPEEVLALMGSIEGPYAFVFYYAETKSLYFARDPLGRRSFLMHRPTEDRPYFVLSSVSDGPDGVFTFEELSTNSIFCVELSQLVTGSDIVSGFGACIHTYSRALHSVKLGLPYAVPAKVNVDIPREDIPEAVSLGVAPVHLQDSVDRLIIELDKAVQLQVRNIHQQPNPCQARIAILFSGGIDSTALCYFADRHVPKGEPIDLLNVAFENPRKLRAQAEGNLDALPKDSRRERKKQEAYERVTQYDTLYMVPDRLSGLEEVEELRQVCPERVWNFVEINVPYEETQKAKPLVESIMFPSRTVMDLSLGLALWFASRGIGVIKSQSKAGPQPYTSKARVLFNGFGSDELLGGYGRHRSAFNSGGWAAIVQELQLEIDRIPVRNLGRDDRIISSHGKETRHPFLSLDLVAFLAGLPVHHKVDLRLELGMGDKLLLRLAMRKVGLEMASVRKKRAMQFGSRSAKMEGERRGDAPLE